MHYENFELHFVQGGSERVEIRAATPEAGEAREKIGVDPGWRDGLEAALRLLRGAPTARELSHLDTSTRHLRVWEAEATSLDLQRRIGGQLFELVFRGEVLSLWDRAAGSCCKEGKGLRIKLFFDLGRQGLSWLEHLPWELLYRRATDEFLAADGRTPLVRFLEVRKRRPRLARAERWRVLVVASQPDGLPPMQLDEEVESLRKHFRHSRCIELVFPERATVGAIREELTRHPDRRIHAVHFMGHGVYDEVEGRGGLVLEDASCGPYELAGGALRDLFSGIEPPLLMVLNGCETARSSDVGASRAFTGAATTCVEVGIPAVVAMQWPVLDRDALRFTETLFGALNREWPIDWSVTEARRALRAERSESVGWANPVLFMRVDDGRLFEPSGDDGEGRPGERWAETNGAEARIVSDRIKGEHWRVEGEELVGTGDDRAAGPGVAEVRAREIDVSDMTVAGRRVRHRSEEK